MASNLKSIADIFERKLFRIPDYQRGFSWEEKQLQDFWDDLERLIEGKAHYTGLLTLEKANLQDDYLSSSWVNDKWLIDSSGFEPYFIVDGQQRLTTIIILIQGILNKINDDELLSYYKKESLIEKYIKRQTDNLKSYVFDYTYNDPSSNYLKSKICNDKSVDFNSPMTIYTRNLETARDFFEKKLKSVDFGSIEKLFKKLTLKLQFNVYEMEEELDVFVTFETTNNRGKPLSKLELLKNRLIFLTTILPNKNTPDKEILFEEQRRELRSTINQAWKTIYEYLGKNMNNLLDDDEFLQNHFFMYFGFDTQESSKFAEVLLNEKFTAKKAQDGDIGIKDVSNYVNSLRESVIQWFKIKNPSHINSELSPELSLWLSRISRLEYPAFYPNLMASFQIKGVNEQTLIDLLKIMERYIFLVFIITQRRSDTGKNYFYLRASKLYKNEITIYNLISEIKARTDDSVWGHDATLNKFREYLNELFKSENENNYGYTGWDGLRYFLYEYESYLKGPGEEKVPWELSGKLNSIEHIYPKNANDECWEVAFKSYNNEEKRKLLINNLGNLLLVSKRTNSSLQNFCFAYKKKHENRKNKELYEGYFNGSYSEIEVSQFQDWTAKEILQRGIKMLEFLEARWQISMGDKQKKRSLLKLDFVN